MGLGLLMSSEYTFEETTLQAYSIVYFLWYTFKSIFPIPLKGKASMSFDNLIADKFFIYFSPKTVLNV